MQWYFGCDLSRFEQDHVKTGENAESGKLGGDVVWMLNETYCILAVNRKQNLCADGVGGPYNV